MLELGSHYPLVDRDSLGRRVVFIQPRRIDTNIYSFTDSMKLLSLIILVLLEEEETQITGIVVIFDCKDTTRKQHLTPADAWNLLHFMKCSAMRLKQVTITSLPSYMNFLTDVIKTVMSEKLRKRILFIKSDKDKLENYIDVKILPKETGGTRSERDMIEEFKQIWIANRQKVNEILDFRPDWSKFIEDDAEAVGSFRKLEID